MNTKSTLVRDSEGYWHTMNRVAHRLIAECGYLNLDAASIERGERASSSPDEQQPTCYACQQALAKAKGE